MTTYKIKPLTWHEISNTFYTSRCRETIFNIRFEFERWSLSKYVLGIEVFSVEVCSKDEGIEEAEKSKNQIILEYLEEVQCECITCS